MLQRVIYGVLHYGKDVLSMMGGVETLCYVALLGTVLAFVCLLVVAVCKKTPVASADIAYVLNKNVLIERTFRMIAKGWFILSLLGVGVDAYTPPSPFLRLEIALGYCVLFFLITGLLQGVLLWVIHGVNGRLSFHYRLLRLAEERKLKLRFQTENAQLRAVEKDDADIVKNLETVMPLKEEAREREALQLKMPLPSFMPKAEEPPFYEDCGISHEGVLDLLNRTKNLPFSETDALRYKKIELAVRDALSLEHPPKETISSLLSALLKLYAKYDGVACT